MNKGVALIILILVLPANATNTFGEQIYPIKECAHALEGRFAYGTYINNQKVGWDVAESKIIEHGEGEVFVESLEMRTVLNYSGNIVISESKYKKVVYSLKDEGQIKNAESESKFFEENDLKTTTTMKKREWIDDYFIQCAAYASMFEEFSGVPCRDLYIFMVSEDGEVKIFEEQSENYLQKLERYMDEFYEFLDVKALAA